jgi:prevent-host-death family protein
MVIMTIMTIERNVGVAQAKAKLAELLDAVERGGRVVVTRRGRPVAIIVPPDQVAPPRGARVGLAAFAGWLAEWDDFPDLMDAIVANRALEDDRPTPDLA